MDMDGTLLDPNNRILSETKDVLMNIQKKGIPLVLASGRSYTRLMPYAEELHMKEYGGYLVEINGTAIYDLKRGKRDVLSQISLEQTKELFHYFMRWDVEILGQLDDGMFCYMSEHLRDEKAAYRKKHHIANDVPWTAGPYGIIYDNRKGYPKITYVNGPDEITSSVNKVSVTYHEDIMKEIRDVAARDLKGRYWSGMASQRWLEIMPLHVTKASGLREISSRSGIAMEEMMAFGDSENDISMLQECGVSVIMGNALDSVKAYGDEITDSNSDNGIAHTLKKHFDL